MDYYLAIDIGASSGRHIIGWLENNEIKTEEVYRFLNQIKTENEHLVWDIDSLFENVKKGIAVALKKYPRIKSLAIDTWGVDYVLMSHDQVISPCYAYRDSRTNKIIDEVHKKISFKKLYSKTGIQFQHFNTIYQLYDDLKNGRLDSSTDFLMIPEYLNYKLTNIKMHEFCNATTTGLVNASSKEYDKKIIEKLNLPSNLFGPLHYTGTKVGMLRHDVMLEVGGQIEVVLCASHDTASAVEGIKMEKNSPYISSGTWSLLGIKVEDAITNESSLKTNYSNEGGVGYTRYQKNIMGMWIINRLRDELCPNKSFELIEKDARNSHFNGYVDINDNIFIAPKSMVEAFDTFLKDKGKPQKEGDYFQCAFVSLAVSYKYALEELEHNCGKQFDELYIVGGGANNKYLNELTECYTKKKVIALPIEATSLGNLKIQMENN